MDNKISLTQNIQLLTYNFADWSYSLSKAYKEYYDKKTDRFRNTLSHEFWCSISYSKERPQDTFETLGERVQEIFETLYFCMGLSEVHEPFIIIFRPVWKQTASGQKTCKNVLVVGLSTVASLYVLALFIIGIFVVIRIHRQLRLRISQSEALEDTGEATQISTEEF